MPITKKEISMDSPETLNNEAVFSASKLKDNIEVIGKTILGLVALYYAAGILVESLYLGSFGVYNINLFRFTYVLAGAWAISIFLVPALQVIGVIFLIRWAFKDQSDPGGQFSRSLVLIFMIASLLFMLGAVFFVEYAFLSFVEIKTDFNLFTQIFTGFLFGGYSLVVSLLSLRLKPKDKKGLQLFMTIGGGVIFIACFFVSLGVFAESTFPVISARFGGGRPLTVQLLLEANKQNAGMLQKNFDLCTKNLSVLMESGETRVISTKPMKLLLATENEYVMRKNERTAVSISRDEVKTVIYLDSIYPGEDVCAENNDIEKSNIQK